MSNWLQDIADLWAKESSEILRQARLLEKITGITGTRKNILFFDPIPWSHTCIDMFLARALQLRGHQVMSILCRDLPVCELERYNHPRISCQDCLNQTAAYPKAFGIPYKIISDFLTEEHRIRAKQIADSVPSESVYDFTFQDLPIGQYVQNSVTGYYRHLPKTMTPPVEELARRYLQVGILVCEATRNMIGQLNIDIVVTTGGESPLWGPIFKMARKMGKKAYNWEDSGLCQKTFAFSNKQPASQSHVDEIWNRYKDRSLTPEQEAQIRHFISGRSKRKMQGDFRVFDKDQIFQHLGLDPAKRTITLFPGLPWDSAIYGLNRAFESLFDWLEWMAEYAVQNPDINLVVRSHPAEGNIPAAMVPIRAKDVILKKVSPLPPNLKIIEPDSPISSHVLAQASDVAMVYVSTMGMEIAIQGKMPWVIGRPHYIHKGFTKEIDTKRQLKELLDAKQVSSALSEEQMEQARRYLYLVFFRCLVEMPFYQGHDHPIYILDSFARLLPNGDPVISDLCEAIVRGQDFVEIGRQPEDERVSIITPFCNMEKTLAETIESVLLQSYKNWELILVDDGSSDNSGRIAEQYARQYPDRIRLIAHEGRINAGASASRNLAFSYSQGRYIAYLDADDMWLPDKLSFEIKLLREHPQAGMVMSAVRYFYENPRAGQADYDQDLSTLREGLYPAPTLCMEFLKNFGVSACPSATLIRREVVERCPWEIPFRRNFTDQVFWAKVTSSTAVYVTRRIVTCYRQHENSSWEIAHRERTFEEQSDKFWSWAARFSDQFTENPRFRAFLLETCNQKMTDQARTDYLRSRKTLASLSGSTLEDEVCWVNYKAQRWLDRTIIAGMKVFEFGSGGSTVYFLNKGCRLISVEHDPDWYEKVKQKLNRLPFGDGHTYILQPPQPSVPGQDRYFSAYPGYEGLSFEKYVRTIDGYENDSFDVVFIDGRARVDCIRQAASKLKQGGFLILDNAERERYRLVRSILAGYSIQDFYGFGPYEPEIWQTLVFTKPSDPAAVRNRPVPDRESHPMESKGSLRMNIHVKELYDDIYPEPLNEVHQIGTLQCLREYKDLFYGGTRILDVGCGQGFAMRQMKQMGLEPVGITLGEEDYQSCRQQGLDVRKMDMSFMEAFEPGSFDGLFVRHSLEHSPMPMITLMEFWRVLKSNGWVILIVPSPDAVIYPNHYSLFEPPVWAHLAGTASFQVESFRSVGEYSLADKKIPREYPEYQFVLRKREKQNSRTLAEKNLEFVKRFTAQTPIDLISENHKNKVNFGSLRRLSPVSRLFGSDRMTDKSLPFCWYYIRRFLAEHAGDIRGQVLEIGDNTYTRMFGGNRITKSDVLHAVPGNKAATVVADLTKADNIPSDAFDCIICTQTLQCIYDVRAAVRNLYRILKPGGVLLVSGSGISQISRYDMDRWGEYWRFTTASFKKLFEEYWPQESIEVQSFGNVLVATAYLQGLVSGDLDENEINFHDEDYQMIILGRAVKPVKPAKRILDHTPQVRSVQPDPADVQKAGSAESDEVRMIADGWDQYAREWSSGKYKVLPGHQVKNIGDEWTAEDVSGGGTTYGLPKDIVDHFDEYINQRLLNAYLPSSADEGLEIGPGGGRLTNLLVHRTRLLHLADSSDTMLGKLKERFANQAHLRYYHTDGLSLPPLRKASLDYVIAFDVFVHFEPRLVYWYLCQISQLLKPGGVCILHYANAMTEIGWTQFESDLKMNIRRREYFASFGTMCPQLMEKFLASLGMEIHSVDTGLIPRDAVAIFSKPVKVSSGDESVLPVLRSRSIQDSVTVGQAGRNPSIVPAGNIRGKSNESLTMPLVLLYHRVADDPLDSQLLAVSPANFREHLNTLKERCRVVPLRQLLEEAQTGRTVPNTVALTFDDGYLDNLSGALPLLEQYGMHATVFITADNIQRTRGFWWDQLEYLFLGNHKLPEQLDVNEEDQNYKWRLDTPGQRLLAYDQLAALLRSRPVQEIEAFVSALFQWAQIQEGPASFKPVLSLLQLQQLSQSPCIEIGSHTLSHTRLSALPIEAQAREILESRRKLESWIGKPVTILSYPYGTSADFTGQTKALVRQAGYQYGIANRQGSVHPNTDLFEVPRYLVRNWPGPVFRQWMQTENKGLLEQQTVDQRTDTLVQVLSGRPRIIEKPAAGKKPKVVLCTLARSGTHWLSPLLSGVLQVPWKYEPYPPGDRIEAIRKQLLESHENMIRVMRIPCDPDVFFGMTDPLGFKVIFLHRDLRDVMASLVKMRKYCEGYRPGLPPFPDMPEHEILKWDLETYGEIFRERLPKWLRFTSPNLFIVSYEQLRMDTKGKLREILNYLGVQVSEEILEKSVHTCDFEQMTKRKPGVEEKTAIARKGIIGDYQNQFTQEQIALIESYMR